MCLDKLTDKMSNNDALFFLCRAFLYNSNMVYILRKKNVDCFYIGSVIDNPLITRFKKHHCFQASSSFDLHRIIQVHNHDMFNAFVIETVLHSHLAVKLGRSFKSIASCGGNGFECNALVLDTTISLVLAESFCDGIVTVVNQKNIDAFNELFVIFGVNIFSEVICTESDSEKGQRVPRANMSEAEREMCYAKNNEQRAKRRANMSEAEKERVKVKNREYKAKRWANMSEAAREMYNAKTRDYRRKKRTKMIEGV